MVFLNIFLILCIRGTYTLYFTPASRPCELMRLYQSDPATLPAPESSILLESEFSLKMLNKNFKLVNKGIAKH